MSEGIHLTPLLGIPHVAPGDDLAAIHWEAAQRAGITLRNGALVLCQKIISKAENRLVELRSVEPSAEALAIAEEFKAFDKDARQIELVLRETKRIVRKGHGVLICETHHGFVCANAGIDLSNAPGDDIAVLLPVDPDASARRLRSDLLALGAEAPLAVVVTDTFGRPWREGLVDVSIGSAGIAPIDDQRGSADMRGRELVVTTQATTDALAAAAGLLMKKDSAIPSVWVEGVPIVGDGGLPDLLRDSSIDLFR